MSLAMNESFLVKFPSLQHSRSHQVHTFKFKVMSIMLTFLEHFPITQKVVLFSEKKAPKYVLIILIITALQKNVTSLCNKGIFSLRVPTKPNQTSSEYDRALTVEGRCMAGRAAESVAKSE